MTHVTPAQLCLLEENLRAGGDAPARGRRREDLPENVLEQQIRDCLAVHGFITMRQHVGAFLPLRVARQLQAGRMTLEQALRNVVRIGEEGITDW